MKKAFIYWAAVTEFVGMVVGGALLGTFLDSKFKTQGIFILFLTLAGFVGGLIQMLRIMKKAENGKKGTDKG